MKMQHHYTKIEAESFNCAPVRQVINNCIRLQNERCYFLNEDMRILDPFARNSFTTRHPGTITNDLNDKFNTDYHMEANDFCELMLKIHGPDSFDLILWDPPYSLRQLKDCYEGIGAKLEQWQTHNTWGRALDACGELLVTNGQFISMGYHSHGLGRKRGCIKSELHVLESFHGSDVYDVLLTVEVKVQHSLLEYLQNGIPEEGNGQE